MFGSKKIVKSQVWLAGLQAFAESDGEERLSAQVELTEMKLQPLAFPLLVTGGASRLFTTLRVEPEYTEPFIDLVEEVREGLEEAENPSEFRVYDHIGEPGALELGGMVFAAHHLIEACVPRLEYELSSTSEASAAMTLRIRSSGPSVMLTFHSGPKNPIVSIAAWSATLDECLRTQPAEECVPSILNGLEALIDIYKETGSNPPSYKVGYQVEQLVAAATASGS